MQSPIDVGPFTNTSSNDYLRYMFRAGKNLRVWVRGRDRSHLASALPPPLTFHARLHAQNTGTSLRIDSNNCNLGELNDTRTQLNHKFLSIEFHCPSEHVINGRQFDCEMHFIFQMEGTPSLGHASRAPPGCSPCERRDRLGQLRRPRVHRHPPREERNRRPVCRAAAHQRAHWPRRVLPHHHAYRRVALPAGSLLARQFPRPPFRRAASHTAPLLPQPLMRQHYKYIGSRTIPVSARRAQVALRIG